jgi:hypothetical protein
MLLALCHLQAGTAGEWGARTSFNMVVEGAAQGQKKSPQPPGHQPPGPGASALVQYMRRVGVSSLTRERGQQTTDCAALR